MSDAEDRKQGIELDVIDVASLIAGASDGENKAQSADTGKTADTSSPPVDSPNETGVPRASSHADTSVSRKGKPLVWFFVGAGILGALVAMVVWYFQLRQTPLLHRTDLSPVAEKAVSRLINASTALRYAISDIDAKTKIINSKTKIEKILQAVHALNRQLPEYESSRSEYIDVVNKYKNQFNNEDAAVFWVAAEFFQQNTDRQYLAHLKTYMAALERYLDYYFDKYESVREKKQPQIQSYERLYMEYKRELTQFERINFMEKEAVRDILARYPYAGDLFLYDEGASIFSWN